MEMYSVTAAQFLCERLISSKGVARDTSGQKTPYHQQVVANEVVHSYSLHKSHKQTPVLAGMSALDCKRLEVEQGAGGDHDLPYNFVFPQMWQQTLACFVLLVRVQRGELQP